MNIKIHFGYIVAILLSIIILLFTLNVGANEKIIGYFNFALTISSIILALIAIIYSFVSNSTISKNLFSITDSSNKISIVSNELEKTTNLLISKMDEVPSLIKCMDKKVDDSIIYIKELSLAKENVNLSNQQFDNKKVEIDDNNYDKLWRKMLYQSSLSYLSFLFALSLSYKSKKPFDFDEYIEKFKGDEQYLFGGKILFTSLGIINIAEKNKKWNVLNINDYIYENICEATYEMAKYLDSDAKEKLHSLPDFIENSFTKDIKEIEEYYK